MTLTIGLIGLSHLGTCYSIAYAAKGLNVIAYDFDEDIRNERISGYFDPAEPGVMAFLQKPSKNFKIAYKVSELEVCDLLVYAKDTNFELEQDLALSLIANEILLLDASVKQGIPLVIMSQVPPGFTRNLGDLRRDTVYQVETLIFGKALNRALQPERIIFGKVNEGAVLPDVVRKIAELFNCTILEMSYESAELTKIAINIVLSANITAANSLAELANRIGGNWSHIERALRLDQRIGESAYISPGLGLGGTNLQRDLDVATSLAEKVGVNAIFIKSITEHSLHMQNWLMREIIKIRQNGEKLETVTILGLAYKPGTQSTYGSAGYQLLEIFDSVVKIFVHDPVVRLPIKKALHNTLQINDLRAHLHESNLVILATAWPEYQSIIEEFLRSGPNVIILDPYRIIHTSSIVEDKSKLIQLGIHEK
jgi:UDPglucose 6-dehydrogenase